MPLPFMYGLLTCNLALPFPLKRLCCSLLAEMVLMLQQWQQWQQQEQWQQWQRDIEARGQAHA